MGIDVYTLAIEYPDRVIQLKISDLVEAARIFARELTFTEEFQPKETNCMNSLLTKREVMELLGISETTLWRWDKKYDYLHPIMIGAKRRWRRKDIEAIMEGNVTDFYGKPISSRQNYNTKDDEDW